MHCMIYKKYFFERKGIYTYLSGGGMLPKWLGENTLSFLWVPTLLYIKAAYHFSDKSEKDTIVLRVTWVIAVKQSPLFSRPYESLKRKEKVKTQMISLGVLLLYYVQSMPSHNNLEFQRLYWLSFKKVFNV